MKIYQLKKTSIKRKKKSNNTNTEQIQSPKRFKSNNTNTEQIQSPKSFIPPSSHSTPKRGNITLNDSFPVDAQSPKIIMSPNAQSTPLSPKSVSNSTSQSPKPSTSFGSPKSHGSPNMLQQVTLSLDRATNFIIDNLTKETLFKDYSPDTYQPGLDKIIIQTHTNTKEKRNFDKYNICLYCAKRVLKMGRHLCEKHSDKEEVIPILEMKSGSVERNI